MAWLRSNVIPTLTVAAEGGSSGILTKEDDGSWLDVILWRSREAAEEAAREVHEVAECAAWFRHIAASGGLRHVEVVDAWAADGDVVELRFTV